MQPDQAISVRDRANWRVAPEALWREINQPGSTDIPKILPTEISMWISVPPDKLRAEDLNNLHMKLFSLRKELLGKDWIDLPDSSNEKVGVRKFNSSRMNSGGPSYAHFEGYSLLYLQGTEAEFYAKIAEAVTKAGISDRDIVELCGAYCNSEKFAPGHFRSLHRRICMPIYAELYKLGYALRDAAA